jgi:L,D-peptidoglycan transpeptidase YkuD (ErfK/YbiS/YcfS/YnhG family)
MSGHPAYNRFVKLPFADSHEALWRKDGAYDIVLVISHNDSPPSLGLGSAVFIHVAQADDRSTLGCVAFAPEDMVRLLPQLYSSMPVNLTR